MALVVYDRVQETTATTGTGSITLGGAVDGFQSFAIVGNGNTTYYCIVNGLQWEVGLGTYSTSGPTLARTTVYSNSSGTLSPITLVGASNVFLTYPSERSVNLNASGNVTALGTVTSGAWNGSTIPVAYGGTGVTASSGANSVMLRDANQNVSINRLNQSNTSTAAAGGITALTAASSYSQTLTGTGNQTYTMPDATTLATGVAFVFNNNATGTLTLQDYASGSIGIVTSGGAVELICVSSSTTGGTWDYHGFLPENVTWGTNALALGGTVITGGTWNGGTIQSGYGGTGLTTFTAANNALYSTSSSALAAGTLPVAAGGTAKTSFTADQVLYGPLSQSSAFTFDGTNLAVTGSGRITKNGSVTSASLATGDSYGTTASWGILGMDSGATNFKVRMYNGGYYFPFSILNSGVVGIGNVEPALTTFDGNLVVAGSQGTGAGTANTRIQVNTYETVSGGGNGLWFGALTDQTTGVIGSRTATGNIAFQTYNGGWGERMRLSYTGNFALGTTTTTSARARFELISLGTLGTVVNVASFGTNGIFSLGGVSGNSDGVYLGTGSSDSGQVASGFGFLREASGWDSAIAFYTNNVTSGPNGVSAIQEKMRLTSTGNLGLGTASPATRLQLGDGSSGQLKFRIHRGAGTDYTDYFSDTGSTIIDTVGGGSFILRFSGTEKIQVTAAGALSFGSSGTNYGSSGQLLQSNGNASPSWINQSSITAGSASNVAGLVQNTYSSYTNIASTTAKSGFYGMLCGTGSNYPALMFDPSGGGIYKENTGFWALYYSYGTSCVGIGNSGTTAGYALQVNGSQYTTGSLITAGNVQADSFVDSNTAYYLNLNGTSNFGTVITGTAQFQSNLGATSGSLSNPPLQAYSTSNNSAFMSFHKGGYYAVNFGLDSDNVLRIGGWSAPANRWQLDMSGNNTIAGYMSATIYYDNPNSSYYVDPDSTSVLYNLTINGTGSKYLRIISTNAQEAMVYYEGGTGTQWYVGKRITAQLVGTADFHWYNVSNNNTMMGLTVAGELLTRGGMYAPTFYDIDNPSYYLNPASRSNLYTFTMGDSNELNQLTTNVTTSSIVGLGFNGGDSSYAIFKSPGAWVQPLNIKFYTGLRLYAAYNYDYGISFWDQVGGGLLMSVGQGDYNVRVSNILYATTAQATTMYSTIYYDSDNTGYYIDGSGTSNVNTLSSYQINSYNINSSSRYENTQDTGVGNIGQIRLVGQIGTNWYNIIMSRPGVADSAYFFASDAWSPNGNAATLWLGHMSWTGRSINAGGSINQYGADYAEYMTKAGDFTIAKGDVCGIDVNGKITNVFADAISFVVKSTKPGLVGGDAWGNEEALGTPVVMYPIQAEGETDESFAQKLAQYAIDKPIFDAKFEAARAKVDRISFCGQVPVNVEGAVSGQYIVAVNDNGAIKGVAVNEDDLTMSQYIKAVGKVIKVVDGKPTIIVKVS